MANNNFKRRFPHSGIFFVIAITLAIPLTVWSLNNVSTNTQQEAAAIIPTPTPQPTSVVCRRCTVKQSDGKYLVGGMCGTDGKTLCQCSGTGTIKSSSRCSTSCKVNAGTFDTCASTTDLCSRCKIKQADNKYLIGGACSFDGKTLCQCSGTGTTKSSSACAYGCQSNPGTSDTCKLPPPTPTPYIPLSPSNPTCVGQGSSGYLVSWSSVPNATYRIFTNDLSINKTTITTSTLIPYDSPTDSPHYMHFNVKSIVNGIESTSATSIDCNDPVGPSCGALKGVCIGASYPCPGGVLAPGSNSQTCSFSGVTKCCLPPTIPWCLNDLGGSCFPKTMGCPTNTQIINGYCGNNSSPESYVCCQAVPTLAPVPNCANLGGVCATSGTSCPAGRIPSSSGTCSVGTYCCI